MRKFFSVVLFLFFLASSIWAQQGKVQGKVVDVNSGEPLVSANVMIVGTNLGTITDENGKFVLENVPVGKQKVKVSYIGYKEKIIEIDVKAGDVVTVNFELEESAIKGQEVVIEVNRAVERETPIAFSNIDQEKLKEKYTAEDVPMLIREVPGVFATTSGLGESEVYVRGFNGERVQILINGIPVNDPESQIVYWSNWTGLSSNAKSIQVQRGVGSSLYGSGAFGGSINISTMGLSPNKQIIFRSSVGYYTTKGVDGGENDGKVADGKGGFEDYNPITYMTSVRYNSGLLYNGKLNFSVSLERKGGEYYINGTKYDGWSFGFEAQSILGAHTLYLSFIGAPQHHNQARTVQDPDLFKTLGREYNRNNHSYQENYYFKPQLSLRDEWTINENTYLLTNVFATMGRGGGKYLRNDYFDVETGENTFKTVKEYYDDKYFGRHARFAYEVTGGKAVLKGYDPDNHTFKGQNVSYGTNLITNTYSHSWRNDSHNNHKQIGFNTAFQQKLNKQLKYVVGGEARYWVADHFAESENFRCSDPDGNVITYKEVQRRYDYTGKVLNMSVFGRVNYSPIEKVNIMADVQYARYSSKIEENRIRIFDFEAGKFTDWYYYPTKDLVDDNGNRKYKDSDYERTFNFVSPKFGINYNLSKSVNFLANYSISYKEPRAADWYDRTRGPGANQPDGKDLDPEKLENIEFGFGFNKKQFGQFKNVKLSANYYIMNFSDKIERVTDMRDERITINAGKAKHQGLELYATADISKFYFSTSLTLAKNRWQKMDVKEIFYEPADSVVDKVVPFSPEKMFHANVGYNISKKLKIGFATRWWDNYYATYSNTYQTYKRGDDGKWQKDKVVSSKIDSYFSLDASISYKIKLKGTDVNFRLNLNNLTNHENIVKAAYSKDYNRNDYYPDYKVYVVPGPLFNVFFTMEVVF